MGVLIKCDKCGVEGEKPRDFKHVRGYVLTSPTTFNTSNINKLDLCNTCYNDIFNIKEDN